MKLTEITQTPQKQLFEELDKDNKSDFLTEDLVKIATAHTDDNWSQPLPLDEFNKLMESWYK